MKIKIEKVEKYDNCQKWTISTMIGKKKHKERFAFSPHQIANEMWKDHVKNWIAQLKTKVETEELEGQEIDLE